MRSTPLFRFKRGDHICVFYADQGALLDFLVPYIVEGLRNGERCFCAQTPAMARRLRKALQEHGVDVQHETERTALEIHTLEEVYFSTGAFAPIALMGLLSESIADASRKGFRAIRMAGEMEFAAHGLCECDQLLEYERLVEEAFPSQPVIGICQYDVRQFSPEMLEAVLATHRHALTETMATTNHSSLAIRKGRYVIDVVADRLDPRSQFYYVAQEHGKRDILGWGVEQNFDDAILQGETLLNSLQAASD